MAIVLQRPKISESDFADPTASGYNPDHGYTERDFIRRAIITVAEREFTASLCWYAERSSQAAADYDAEFDRALLAIRDDPKRFPQCDARHSFYLMRSFPYQIIFRFTENEIYVVAVARTSREPGYWHDQ